MAYRSRVLILSIKLQGSYKDIAPYIFEFLLPTTDFKAPYANTMKELCLYSPVYCFCCLNLLDDTQTVWHAMDQTQLNWDLYHTRFGCESTQEMSTLFCDTCQGLQNQNADLMPLPTAYQVTNWDIRGFRAQIFTANEESKTHEYRTWFQHIYDCMESNNQIDPTENETKEAEVLWESYREEFMLLIAHLNTRLEGIRCMVHCQKKLEKEGYSPGIIYELDRKMSATLGEMIKHHPSDSHADGKICNIEDFLKFNKAKWDIMEEIMNDQGLLISTDQKEDLNV